MWRDPRKGTFKAKVKFYTTSDSRNLELEATERWRSRVGDSDPHVLQFLCVSPLSFPLVRAPAIESQVFPSIILCCRIFVTCILTCSCTCPLLYWPTVIYLWYLIWHGVSLITNCLRRKKHKHQKGKRFGHKWGPSSVPTILICIKNNNYKLNKQTSCNLIFIFFFWFFCFFLIINLFVKVELEHANRPSSVVLTQKSSRVRFVEDVNCGTHHLKGTQPQLIP